ncbi:DUF3800 domain-containing protein [Corynebacterium aurimucosum]|uniref:DUF3800 domain-containing protein n=1 Tax=Corynebacterium aurimucosum TaxID=169292 RepID=UPI000AA97D4D|nr:DUF3800 domain-containing protein [Corynebacterium aurimucosum]
MNIYIDDSGDGGFKFRYGSSVHLVFVAVIFDSPQVLEPLSDRIELVKRQTNYQGEIKFSKSSSKVKMALLKEIGGTDLRIRAIAADKRFIYSKKLRENPAALKAFLIRMLLSKHDKTISNAKVFIDGKDTRGFSEERSDVDYFMRMCNREYPDTAASVRFVDSEENVGIQIADMVAGALRRSLDRGENEYFDLVKPKTRRKLGGTFWNFTRKEVQQAKVDNNYVEPWNLKCEAAPNT